MLRNLSNLLVRIPFVVTLFSRYLNSKPTFNAANTIQIGSRQLTAWYQSDNEWLHFLAGGLPLGISCQSTFLFFHQPSKYKTFAQHLCNAGPTSSTSGQNCINVKHMVCDCWESIRCHRIVASPRLHEKRKKPASIGIKPLLVQCWSCIYDAQPTLDQQWVWCVPPRYIIYCTKYGIGKWRKVDAIIHTRVAGIMLYTILLCKSGKCSICFLVK